MYSYSRLFFSGFSQFNFTNILQKAKVKYFYAISDVDRKVITGHTHDWIDSNRIDYYSRRSKDIIRFYQILEDCKSKNVLYNYCKSYMMNCTYTGKAIPTRFKYFCDDNDVELYTSLDNEVWINCGAAMGDTIFSYFARGRRAKRIYAFEEDGMLFRSLQDNINILPLELQNAVKLVNDSIGADTDFRKHLEGNKCTLINADIEGNEMKMLKSMLEIIVNDRPVVAICLYHKKEDIIEIPHFLIKSVNHYKYYLRKYTPSIVNIKRNHEIVLYAIPEERCICD